MIIVKGCSGIACDWCASLDISSILALNIVLFNKTKNTRVRFFMMSSISVQRFTVFALAVLKLNAP